MNDLHFEQLGLQAAIRLHAELSNDDGFFGYDGGLDAFTRLAQECTFIARKRIAEEICPVTQIVETFYGNHAEISDGQRDCCYWMAA